MKRQLGEELEKEWEENQKKLLELEKRKEEELIEFEKAKAQEHIELAEELRVKMDKKEVEKLGHIKEAGDGIVDELNAREWEIKDHEDRLYKKKKVVKMHNEVVRIIQRDEMAKELQKQETIEGVKLTWREAQVEIDKWDELKLNWIDDGKQLDHIDEIVRQEARKKMDVYQKLV